ncbi:outer membrane protein assembly factor BamE [Palleronia caenipelagi]|uniref:Outer membrane protein assembly factor BamE n=1 Tax=Palleronia caenipelagi TaxID=2489174 RepID=A0A547PXV2_9RHOB|nr:outer membrane protein assembly factor BamE [Palleronia caenipelagi]TRD18944.1 outer membrane protein assembly factor BamE [Palleronia caenipelagi]
MTRQLRLLVLAGAALILAACATVYQTHGYAPPANELAAIEVGRSTQTDVAELVGRPTTEGIIDDRGWYYVESLFRRDDYRRGEEIYRQVVAISFSEAGVVSNVERFGLKDGRVVPISRRVTEANVQGVSFLRQLFQSIGNFNPADLAGE